MSSPDITDIIDQIRADGLDGIVARIATVTPAEVQEIQDALGHAGHAELRRRVLQGLSMHPGSWDSGSGEAVAEKAIDAAVSRLPMHGSQRAAIYWAALYAALLIEWSFPREWCWALAGPWFDATSSAVRT